MTLTLDIPRLETPRLVLRGPEPQDFEPLCAFLGVPVPDEPFPRTNDRSASAGEPCP